MMRKNKSIRAKLIEVFVVVMVLVFALNLYITYRQNDAVHQIDNVYSNNIQLNDLSTALEKMQSALYQYLNTKSSGQLEKYYSWEQEISIMLKMLNQKTVSDSNKLMEKNIYNMCRTYIVNADNAIEAKRGRDISKYNTDYGEAKKLYDYLQTNINSLNTEVFLKNSGNYSLLRVSLNYLTGISFSLLLLAIILAVIWIIARTRNIIQPLISLASTANEIAKGNMEVDFPVVDTGDEITIVAKACNKMIDSIRLYIEQIKHNYEREKRLVANEWIMKNDLKEAQLKYLQAQVNPHFLFNSLNAGAQLAMLEGAERTYLFVENMADFFRYNVCTIGKDATLKEELDLVDHYVYILNVRFAGDIHYETQIDERFLNVRMPSMILQPIVENAVNHGIREMEGEGKIRVNVYGKDREVCIKVADNGVGIQPQIAEKILRGESVHSHSDRDSAGVGMDNVIKRLRRYYNKEHVIDIGNGERGGTEVVVYIDACEMTGGENSDTNSNM